MRYVGCFTSRILKTSVAILYVILERLVATVDLRGLADVVTTTGSVTIRARNLEAERSEWNFLLYYCQIKLKKYKPNSNRRSIHFTSMSHWFNPHVDSPIPSPTIIIISGINITKILYKKLPEGQSITLNLKTRLLQRMINDLQKSCALFLELLEMTLVNTICYEETQKFGLKTSQHAGLLTIHEATHVWGSCEQNTIHVCQTVVGQCSKPVTWPNCVKLFRSCF